MHHYNKQFAMVSYKATMKGVQSFYATEKLFTNNLKWICILINEHRWNYIVYVCLQVAIKIIDKTQLNPGSLQKVSF